MHLPAIKESVFMVFTVINQLNFALWLFLIENYEVSLRLIQKSIRITLSPLRQLQVDTSDVSLGPCYPALYAMRLRQTFLLILSV